MNPQAEIIHGDALDVMRSMRPKSVDAIVTDPPFGIGFAYSHGADVAATPADYGEWLRPIYAEMLRVLRPGGFIAIWQTQLYFRHFWDWFGDDIHIYAACKNFVQMRPTAINYGYDPVVMRYKPGADPLCPHPARVDRSVDFFVANTATILSTKKTRPRLVHPCPRPLDQARVIVRNYTLPGGLVLDPFMGSGTTGLACVIEKRKFLGVEREAEYVAEARERVAGRIWIGGAQLPLLAAGADR